jgi:peptidoglycan/xylan/chitin deacetylase (PgdA/CDA1 family)
MLLVAVLTQLVADSAQATTQTRVTLDFDNGVISQYTLGYQQALAPHSAPATFFVNSGTIGASSNFMTWAQLSTMVAAGMDIGGKSVNATNLTTDPNPGAQVCNDRAALLQHGLQPVSFAYPGGATNASVQGIVQSCGYGNARTAGSLSPAGPTYAETLPPKNWFATRAYAPSGQIALANMQALVNGAAANNGGWSQIVIGKVCSQASDPANYSTCTASSGWIELADLNAFLDWMGAAGQAGGAPAGAVLSTSRTAVVGVDPGAPTTTITCNAAACSTTPYPGLVTVALAATDTGAGVASTHFTTDGTVPTLASPTYAGPFTVNGSSATITVMFRSWDWAGNVEATNTQVITAPPDTSAPSTTISCNNSACTTAAYVSTVTVSFSATDTGGSGLAATYYTTDGSTPTPSSAVYVAPFALTTPGTYRIQYFSTDKAGNSEAVNTEQVSVVPVTTRVSLTFDNGTISQYQLAYLHALQPHSVNATFFVNSGTISSSANTMTWDQLSALAVAGNDIGGKTVNATNLKTDPNPTAQVCNDRAALRQHGLDPVAFAYPGGAFDSTLEAIVKTCGYGTGRTAGSLSPTGPTYAETAVPKDWYATRAYAPTGQVTLANLQALVTGAATHGGGWSQVVIGRVCSQGSDPSNYAGCTVSAGWIELDDLNTFLDWMGAAGQAGGAPAGALLSTVRAAATAADTVAPVTTIACNAAACDSGTYPSTVYATFAATDAGSAVASTHYTTNGDTPTLASPTFTAPIPVTGTTTIAYASWDNAGNAEAVATQLISVSQPADSTPPATTINCDGSPCTSAGYNGSTSVTLVSTDAGGWGVDKTYYTLDGSTPDTSSTVYTGAITLSSIGTVTVKFFSTDLAGNTEPVQSQTILVLAPKVVVSLTFDDGIENQYLLGYQRALAPHGLTGTYYNVSGLNDVDPQHMTWSELTALNNAGNEIGGHTVDHVNLKTMTDTSKITYEVCQDRQNLLDHGFYPTSFAYPEGAYDATDEAIVQQCGYTSGRAAGGIDVAGDGAGPLYTETIPPKDPYALRTVYDAPTGTPPNVPPISLAHLEATVTAAAAHGGGWVPLVFHQICSQQFDPDNYASCIADWGPVELSTLNAFLDWLQSSAAPPRLAVQTVSQVINGPDTQAPISVLDCDGAPCHSSTYLGSVTVSAVSKDPGGSGVAATYYTTDGSTPTTASPKFTAPFTINQTTTFTMFSVDNAGNVEPVTTQVVSVSPNPDPIVGAAGDIACDPTQPAFNNGLGTDTDCRAAHTIGLLNGVDAVLPLGDDQYNCGGAQAWAQSYGPTWGQKKSITRPVPGDADYATSGGTDCPTTAGAGYFQYFGAAAGDPSKGYYSYNLGTWHVIAINTAPCEADPATCQAGSAQDTWLKQDLAANRASCTMAYYQNPRFTSTAGGGNTDIQAIWQDLYNGHVDVVLNGDSHWYERFAQLNAGGAPDPASGVREFIVGTGGQGLDTPAAQLPTSQVLNDTTHGVLRMTLHAGSYDWSFVPDEGTFTDTGTANCHGQPDVTAPATVMTCNGTTCSAGWYTDTVQATLTAVDNTGGSGVAKTYYTTDGSTPTTSSTVYSGPFAVPATSTVKYFSVDNSGNVEPVRSQVIQIDSKAPTTSINCNNLACSSTAYLNSASVSLTSTDGAGGSGVASTHYTTDGSDPSLSSPTYTAAFVIRSTTTVKYRSWDRAGNVEATGTQVITVATDAPPVAVLAVSPSSGLAPLTVTADASGSTDTDPTPIAGYTYNWGDGTTALTTTASTATHRYTKTGTFTLTLTVKDRANLSSMASKQVISQANLISNSGFESSTNAWTTGSSTVRLARTLLTAHSGLASAQVSNAGTSAQTCVLKGSPNFVGKTAAGTYTATLWVRGATSGATLTMQLAELSGTTVVGSASASLALTTSWQQVKVSYVARSPGATALNLIAAVGSVARNATAFYADDAVLVLG